MYPHVWLLAMNNELSFSLHRWVNVIAKVTETEDKGNTAKFLAEHLLCLFIYLYFIEKDHRCVIILLLMWGLCFFSKPNSCPSCLCLNRKGRVLKNIPSIDGLPFIGINKTLHDGLHMTTLRRSQISVLSYQLSWNHCMSSVKMTSSVPSSIGYEDSLRQQATFLLGTPKISV